MIPFTPRHQMLIPAWERFSKAIRKIRVSEQQAQALFNLYPTLTRQKRIHPMRQRGENLIIATTAQYLQAHKDFKEAVKIVGGPEAQAVFAPPLGYHVTLPKYRNTYKEEIILFGTTAITGREQ